MKIDDLIKSYKKRKGALEIWKTSAVIKGTEKIVVQKQIQDYDKFIEELESLECGRDKQPTESATAILPDVRSSLPKVDLIPYIEWVGSNFIKMAGGWMKKYADQRNLDNLIKTKDLFDLYISVGGNDS